jgi:Domain of unknown function (DUF4383)
MTSATNNDPPRRRGVSLAKGPVALMGLASLAFGVLGFIFGSQSFAMHPLRGTVNGGTFLGVEGNGWTWALFAAGGLLLLLGSRMHWGAKTTAMIVGIAYAVTALLAVVDGSDALGIFAANGWTELVLGAAAVALLVLSMMPRVGRRRAAAPARGDRGDRATPAERFAGNGHGTGEPIGGRSDTERRT